MFVLTQAYFSQKKNFLVPKRNRTHDLLITGPRKIFDSRATKSREKSIRLKTTGNGESKVSVCLAAKADGIKLKPFIVFPGAKRETKQLNEEFKNKCYVASSVNKWMNEDLTFDWVQGVLGIFSFTRRMLAWDSFKCHLTDSIKQDLAKAKIDPVIVPGGCTRYIQAFDVA